MRKTPFLDFYYQCMESGKMPCSGLCESGLPLRLLRIFEPEWYDDSIHVDWPSFWAFDGIHPMSHKYERACMDWSVTDEFTPLRQTIVLFCSAINEEL